MFFYQLKKLREGAEPLSLEFTQLLDKNDTNEFQKPTHIKFKCTHPYACDLITSATIQMGEDRGIALLRRDLSTGRTIQVPDGGGDDIRVGVFINLKTIMIRGP